ncbi:MAG: hypothetical protein GY774_06335 [Planctomycetes bacterium]|nr:hypothetical protein [Planctomycetota bacterium]
MTPIPAGISHVIHKYLARIVGGPKFLARSTAAATLSLAQDFLDMSNLGQTIGRIKESHLRKMEANTTAAETDAQKRSAEAAKEANIANLHKRKDAIARLEREQKEAQLAKTKAQAHAIRKDAETRRIQAMAEAKTRFFEAFTKLQQEGGRIFIDPDILNQILHTSLPPEDDEDEKES